MTKHFMEVSIGIFLLTVSGTLVLAAFKISTSMDRQYAQQQEVLNAAKDAQEVFVDFGFLFTARTLEAQGTMSPTDANAVATQSLKKLSDQSERVGILAKALNDAFLKKGTK